MGKDYCCMTDCHNYPGKYGRFGKKVTLHKIPKETYTRRAWIRAISRKNWKATNYTRVCSDHFKDGVGPNSLDKHKIPTENLAQKKPTTAVQSRKPKDRTYHAETIQNSTVFDHSTYAKDKDNNNTIPASSVNTGKFKDQETSTDNSQFYASQGVSAFLPEITIENIKDSKDNMMFYTGLPDYGAFISVFETLMENGADTLATDCEGNINSQSRGRKRKLRRVDEFLLVMMRLRLGLLVKDLEYRFKISASSVSKIFNSWIAFMHECLQSSVFLPNLDVLQQHVPKCFTDFSDTRVVLDCTELYVQTPSSLENKSMTYSNYKSHNTFKALIGVSMTGTTVHVSKLYPGSASDVEITRKSGLIEQLHAGDAVMVDKGFVHLHKDFSGKGIKLYCPPFKTKEQFSKSEVEMTRRIASARIHVERKMEQIKNFRILQGIMPLALSNFANEIFFVCASLTNILPALVPY